MTRLMQTASALTLAAALAGAPMIAMAQQATETESEAEQAVENVAQETEEAAGAAADAVGEAAQETGEALDNAAQETGEALDNAAQETGEALDVTVETIEPNAEQAGEEQVEVIEQTGEEQVEVVEEGAEGAVVVEAEPVEPVEGAIQLQDDNSILTSDLMGATVYNAQAEKVGEIDDAILSLDGTIDGVVIGVGGFLGLGEKHVAVEMQQISVQTDERGQPTLLLDTTREALEAAPEFVTAEDQRDEAERLEAATAPAGGMSTSDTAPAAPASGMVPPPPAPAGEAQPVQN